MKIMIEIEVKDWLKKHYFMKFLHMLEGSFWRCNNLSKLSGERLSYQNERGEEEITGMVTVDEMPDTDTLANHEELLLRLRQKSSVIRARMGGKTAEIFEMLRDNKNDPVYKAMVAFPNEISRESWLFVACKQFHEHEIKLIGNDIVFRSGARIMTCVTSDPALQDKLCGLEHKVLVMAG